MTRAKERRERGMGSLRGDRGSLSRGRVVLPRRGQKRAKKSWPTPDARSFVIFNYGRVRGEDCVATLDREGVFFSSLFPHPVSSLPSFLSSRDFFSSPVDDLNVLLSL